MILIQDSLAAIYKYVDENGNVCFTDSLQAVPEKYREKAIIADIPPESVVKKSPENLPAEKKESVSTTKDKEELLNKEKIAGIVKGFTDSRPFKLIAVITISLLLFVILVKISIFIWQKKKRKIKLIFKKNKLVKSEKHSGRLCKGFDNCIYPDSIQQYNMQSYRFVGESSVKYKFCSYRQGTNASLLTPNTVTTEEYEKFMSKHSFCYHPSEFIPADEWRCYKCNSIVLSEKERHC